MTVFKNELKLGRTSLIIWSAVVAFLLGICVLIYPEMGADMSNLSDIFSDMGSFSQAFGMDKINFGEFLGFFSVECGNVLGMGGAFFSALIAIKSLAGEEAEHTAEFLFTHPVSRGRIVFEKLLAVIVRIIIFNLAIILVSVLAIMIIGEKPDTETIVLLFLAYFIMQIETAAVCFGISAFINRGAMGLGLGLAAVFYFLNLIANMIEETKILKYFTPFGYTDGADIIADKTLAMEYLAAGIVFTIAGIVAGFVKYTKKDLK